MEEVEKGVEEVEEQLCLVGERETSILSCSMLAARDSRFEAVSWPLRVRGKELFFSFLCDGGVRGRHVGS